MAAQIEMDSALGAPARQGSFHPLLRRAAAAALAAFPILACWVLALGTPAQAVDPPSQAKPATVPADKTERAETAPPKKQLILPGETFEVGGLPAFIMPPPAEKRQRPQPWIFYAPTLPPYPDAHEKWMHEQFLAAGVAVAGIDVGEAYGNPEGRKHFTELYRELTEKRGYGKRPCLFGRSRGGLWVSSWAIEHPDNVAGIVGIYPVFDLRAYPGLARAAPVYGLSLQELQSQLGELNPIERVSVLAKAHIPAYFIHGDVDKVVPLAANSAEFVRRYQAAGAGDDVTLTVIEGQGHNFYAGFFHCQPLVDFAIARARAGAEETSTEE